MATAHLKNKKKIQTQEDDDPDVTDYMERLAELLTQETQALNQQMQGVILQVQKFEQNTERN